MTNKKSTNELHEVARDIRIECIKLSQKHKNGHIASAFSYVEIVTVLYEKIMSDYDQFILSKGHGSLSLFAMLQRKGKDPHICGHPDIDKKHGIECTTGSLGHGICIGVGKALAKRIKNEKGIIYVVIGDGECQEGSVWEAFNLIRAFDLKNIVVIIDHNRLQALDFIAQIGKETNLSDKIKAFGCCPITVDGHDCAALVNCFSKVIPHANTPCVVIANTIKGKGIRFMENIPEWHVRMMTQEEAKTAIDDVRKSV